LYFEIISRIITEATQEVAELQALECVNALALFFDHPSGTVVDYHCSHFRGSDESNRAQTALIILEV